MIAGFLIILAVFVGVLVLGAHLDSKMRQLKAAPDQKALPIPQELPEEDCPFMLEAEKELEEMSLENV